MSGDFHCTATKHAACITDHVSVACVEPFFPSQTVKRPSWVYFVMENAKPISHDSFNDNDHLKNSEILKKNKKRKK